MSKKIVPQYSNNKIRFGKLAFQLGITYQELNKILGTNISNPKELIDLTKTDLDYIDFKNTY